MQSNVILGVLLTLLNSKKVTAQEIADKFEISRRTVFRYLNILSEAGVPVYSTSGLHGGISITENFKLKNLYFTEREYNRIITALKSYDAVVKDDLNQDILDKLLALSQLQDRNYVLQSDRLLVDAPLSSSFQDKVAILENAVFLNRVCFIRYHSRKGEVTEREIEPHSFVIKDGLWYVYAFCRFRQDFRLFKISRIYSITKTETTFERKELPLKTPEELKNDAEFSDIVLKISPSVRSDVEDWLGVENIFEQNGEVLAKFRLPQDNELKSKILSFGDKAEVLAPVELKEELKTTVLNLAKLYLSALSDK